MNGFVLWIAQGFGVGRIPVAPGTLGSVVGMLWFILLLLSGELWWFLGATLVGAALAIWVCGSSERILKQKDPPSVVLDEVVAIPLCYLGWLGLVVRHTGSLPAPEYFLSRDTWVLTVAVFAAYRLFDVVKPWPIRQSQALPGGWGIVADDALAAVYANAAVLAAYAAKSIPMP